MDPKDLEAVEDPMQEEVVEPVEPTADEKLEDLQSQLQTEREARIRAEATAEARVAPSTPVQGGPTEEQKVKLAEEYGFTDPRQVDAVLRLNAGVEERANARISEMENKLKLESTITSAKKRYASSDNQFSKLEGHMDEYLDGISVEDKLDPTKLDLHMKRAATFARGSLGVNKSQTRGRKLPTNAPAPAAKEDEVETGEDKYFDTHTNAKGTIRLVTRKLVDDDYRKANAHSEIDGAVEIDTQAEWDNGKAKFGLEK